jgi:cell division protein FtsW (lipid II flippase)
VRFVFPVLALFILLRAIRSLLRIPHTPEIWGQLSLPNGTPIQLTHWENIIGRGQTADVFLNYPSISRQHAALCRNDDDDWTLYDLGSTGGTFVNGEQIEDASPVKMGDTVTLGGVPMIFLPQTIEEKESFERRRKAEQPATIWPSFLWLTLFQVLTCLQLIIAKGSEVSVNVPLTFLGLTGVMWVYFIVLRLSNCVGFEMETIAFFLSTLSLSVTATSNQAAMPKQFLAILLGLFLFLLLGLFLRDLANVKKIRWVMAGFAVGLLGITLVLGHAKFGAVNWISLGGFSFQPSELAKICYIFAGSATLERLFRKRNLTMFIGLTGACIGLLGLMSDFGTAAIFFVTFLVIAYMRSGDFATLTLICGAAVFGAGIILKFKPYILKRFATWGHAWQNVSTSGFQQTRTMSAAASGGLVGMGAGNGWLHKVPAADTDLVFGILCEEWGTDHRAAGSTVPLLCWHSSPPAPAGADAPAITPLQPAPPHP